MLKSMDNWGTFLFFAGWCFVASLYVYVAVPETAGLSMEATDKLFEGPFWQTSRRAREQRELGIVIKSSSRSGSVENVDGAYPKGDKADIAKVV
jgi:hypothetical protein